MGSKKWAVVSVVVAVAEFPTTVSTNTRRRSSHMVGFLVGVVVVVVVIVDGLMLID